MDILYHFPLCPFSRKVRVFLKEKKINFSLIEENPWKKREEFIKINPVCQVPVLINNQNIIIDSQAICEYIEETHDNSALLGGSPYKKSEVRKLISWIDYKFYHEVTKYVISEKIAKYYIQNKSPDSRFLRAAMYNLQSHIKYIEHLIHTNGWLVSHEFTLADITLSAHISVLDYIDTFPWNISNTVKEWYSLIKSRSSFAPILHDKISGFTPPMHYPQLDF
ncbi:glutathione S-transferase family protein [Candidatus Neoehrlichia procyonis]|uniref:Glutaredoxin family protein n=1 Tax=Candidatus Neoehrlichia procyonis str. RAC413 TaxID=1359163 RepID=A0A0F3NKV0_9RICK|nr:glutathione S-transferase family protein [Candidatus Neoehrlichia lotoris]KJV68645.1 glutaredoxin family protein [Candidatus Neoehrlichia lotoris str. RAC413]